MAEVVLFLSGHNRDLLDVALVEDFRNPDGIGHGSISEYEFKLWEQLCANEDCLEGGDTIIDIERTELSADIIDDVRMETRLRRNKGQMWPHEMPFELARILRRAGYAEIIQFPGADS